jgi:hypothetical protein
MSAARLQCSDAASQRSLFAECKGFGGFMMLNVL